MILKHCHKNIIHGRLESWTQDDDITWCHITTEQAFIFQQSRLSPPNYKFLACLVNLYALNKKNLPQPTKKIWMSELFGKSDVFNYLG